MGRVAAAWVTAWALVSACGAREEAARDAAPGPYDAAATDATAQWAPSPVQLTDQRVEVAGHSPSGRYVVAVDEADPAYVLLDTEGESPPRRLPSDVAGYDAGWLFSPNEQVIAYLNQGNLVVADVPGGPERVMGTWQAEARLGPSSDNAIDEDFRWLVELSQDGKWILWVLDPQSEDLSEMLRVASTEDGEPIIAERTYSQYWDVRPFRADSATFVRDDVVLYAPVANGHVLARSLGSGAVQDLGPGPGFLVVSGPRVLVWNHESRFRGPLSVVDLGTGGSQPLSEDVHNLEGDRDGGRAAYFAGDDLTVLDAETLGARRLGLFSDFWARLPSFTGTSDGIVLLEKGCDDPKACGRSSLLVGLDGTAGVLSTADGAPFPLARTGVVVVREPWYLGSEYYVRAPGEERRLLGHEVLLRIKASPDGRRVAFLDGKGDLAELAFLDVDADTVTDTGWKVIQGFRNFGFSENGALVGRAITRIYSGLDRPDPALLAHSVTSMDMLPRDRVVYANSLGVFVVPVPAP